MRLSPAICALLVAGFPTLSLAAEPLTLEKLVELARTNDVRVKEAEADLRVFEAKYSQAKWAWFPKFESTLITAGPTPEARNDGLGGPPLTEATKMYDANFGTVGWMVGAEANALLPLYTFGKLGALREAGEQGPIAGEQLKKRAQDEAAYDAARAFYGYQLARMGKEGLKETATRLDDASKLIDQLVAQESTQVSKIDTYKVSFFRKQLEAKQASADSGLQLATAAIRLLSGAKPGEPVEVEAQDLEAPTFELLPIDKYVDLARENRPELKAIAAGVTAREKEVFIRQRQYLPDFGLLGFFRWRYTTSSTRQLSPFAYDPYNDLSGGVALVMHATFDIPMKMAVVEEAQGNLDKMRAQQGEIEAGMRLELQQIYGDLQNALLRAKSLAEAERSARRWATAAYANFEVGTGDTRELVDSFTALAMASNDKLQAWHDSALGIRALSRAVGMRVDQPAAVRKSAE
ncbi:MAG: TolC family protein [Myxococcaceae bacterium]